MLFNFALTTMALASIRDLARGVIMTFKVKELVNEVKGKFGIQHIFVGNSIIFKSFGI